MAQIFSHPGPTSTVTTDPGDSSPSVSDFVIFVRARCSRQQPVSLSDCCQGILCFRVPTAAGAHPSALASARAVEKVQARALTMIRFFFGRLRHFFALFPMVQETASDFIPIILSKWKEVSIRVMSRQTRLIL